MAEEAIETRVANVAKLGRALTALGLEDKFLSNGELANHPLLERGVLAGEIISEKLKAGRWPAVIEMIYGGLGKADALFEGDRNQLKQDILDSAKRDNERLSTNAITALIKNKEYDLFFNLVNILPMEYEYFTNLVHHIDSSFFEGPEGLKRTQTYNHVAAEKAMKEKKYWHAFRHSKDAGDEAGIAKVFDEFVSESSPNYDFYRVGEEIALATKNPVEAVDRLKRLVLAGIKSKSRVEAIDSLKLTAKHSLPFTKEEKKKLYDYVAETARDYQIEKEPLVQENQELLFLWAKEHVKTDSQKAYAIFRKQGYEGPLLRAAVKAAAQSPIELGGIEEKHYRQIYGSLSSKQQLRIAWHLKDTKLLQSFSQKAFAKKEYKEAYNLWVIGQGDFQSEYAHKVREKCIEEAFKERFISLPFYARDTDGQIQAFEAFMKAGTELKKPGYFVDAYGHALNSSDEARVQAAREKLVERNPAGALQIFSNRSDTDFKGIDYVLGVIGKQTGVPFEQLKGYVDKYTKKD